MITVLRFTFLSIFMTTVIIGAALQASKAAHATGTCAGEAVSSSGESVRFRVVPDGFRKIKITIKDKRHEPVSIKSSKFWKTLQPVSEGPLFVSWVAEGKENAFLHSGWKTTVELDLLNRKKTDPEVKVTLTDGKYGDTYEAHLLCSYDSIRMTNELTKDISIAANDAVCPKGGVVTVSGLDQNKNGVLDKEDILQRDFFCK